MNFIMQKLWSLIFITIFNTHFDNEASNKKNKNQTLIKTKGFLNNGL